MIYSSDNSAVSHDLVIDSGASVTVNATKNLSIHGDFTNNGVASLGNGTEIMAGTSIQHIGGLTPSEFGSLHVDNTPAGTALILNRDSKVSTVLNMLNINGNIDLNGYSIDLGSTGSLSNESNSNRIFCSAGTGTITANLDLSATTNYSNIAGIGLSIQTRQVAPGITQFIRGHTQQIANTNISIERYFDIHPATNANLNATIGIGYFDGELGGGSQNEADLIPWRLPENTTVWEGQFYPSRITRQVATTSATNWVTLDSGAAFSRWTLSDWNTEPLPVELLDFTAVANGSVVDLSWTTASEINNDYFTVERSTDAIHFGDILTKDGAGNSTTIRNYSDIDSNPIAGLSYYRLRQTDFNGQQSESKIVPVVFNPSSNFVNAFVNAEQNFQLVIQGDRRAELVNVAVFDLAGKLVLTEDIGISKGANHFILTNPGIATGVYVIRITGESQLYNKKLFVK